MMIKRVFTVDGIAITTEPGENGCSAAEEIAQVEIEVDEDNADYFCDICGEQIKPRRLRCDQCEMVSINGLACHETGCPNSKKEWDPEEEEWFDPRDREQEEE